MQYQQTLDKLKQRLSAYFGKALDRIIVFGSVARDAVTPESDIDVMVIFDDSLTEVNWRTEEQVIDVAYPLELEDDVVFDLKVMGKQEMQGKYRYMPFVEHVLEEGVTV